MVLRILGLMTPMVVFLLVYILQYILPGKWADGYACKKNTSIKLKYKLNGTLVFLIILLIWAILGHFHILNFNWFYLNRWYGFVGASILGVVFSIIMVCAVAPIHRNFLKDFYLGRYENPQINGGLIDAKLWLYLSGSVLLVLNILSAIMYHQETYGEEASTGLYMSGILLSFFVVDYISFEEVHLYTYDFIAEKIGFKLGWGCLAFYPYFYCISIWYGAEIPNTETSFLYLAIATLIFFIGWGFSRGANLQKYFFKNNQNKNLPGIHSKYITDGKNRIIVNGFWGMSRHINYLGEILMAVGITLCVSHGSIIPWLYPLYYVFFLKQRQKDDDHRCQEKYGALWNEYKLKVPYKIIPYLY